MKALNFVSLGVLAFFAMACAGLDYAMEHYSGVPVETVRIPLPNADEIAAENARSVDAPSNRPTHRTYRIFNKPTEGRMMITASLGDAAAQGAVQGATYGVVSGAQPGPVYMQAAQYYLDQKGTGCQTKSVALIIEPQYEVHYDCPQLSDAEPT